MSETKSRHTARALRPVEAAEFPPLGDDRILPVSGVFAVGDPRGRPRQSCASCESEVDLYFPDVADDEDRLCQDCRTPLVSLDFPKHYCDIGGEG